MLRGCPLARQDWSLNGSGTQHTHAPVRNRAKASQNEANVAPSWVSSGTPTKKQANQGAQVWGLRGTDKGRRANARKMPRKKRRRRRERGDREEEVAIPQRGQEQEDYTNGGGRRCQAKLHEGNEERQQKDRKRKKRTKANNRKTKKPSCNAANRKNVNKRPTKGAMQRSAKGGQEQEDGTKEWSKPTKIQAEATFRNLAITHLHPRVPQSVRTLKNRGKPINIEAK